MATAAASIPASDPIRVSLLSSVAIVGAAGAIGGIVFCILSYANLTPPVLTGLAPGIQFLANGFLGGVAAFLGVFFLTASDTTRLRTYGFALICGCCWQPVLVTARGALVTPNAQQQADSLGAQAETLQVLAGSGTQTQIASAVNNVAPSALNTLDNVGSIQNDDVRTTMVTQTGNSINGLLAIWKAKQDPHVIDSIAQIGVRAGEVNVAHVTLLAVQALRQISDQSSGNEKIKKQVADAIAKIHAATQNQHLAKAINASAAKAGS